MNSRIFQISRNPIDPKDHIKAEDYKNSRFVSDEVMDIEEENLNDQYEWLESASHKGIKVDFENKTFTIIDKKAFFETNFNEWKEALEKLADITLEDFSQCEAGSPLDWNMYVAETRYEDKHGFYIDDRDEYWGRVTMDYFMRSIEEGDTFYLGGVVYYHF